MVERAGIAVIHNERAKAVDGGEPLAVGHVQESAVDSAGIENDIIRRLARHYAAEHFQVEIAAELGDAGDADEVGGRGAADFDFKRAAAHHLALHCWKWLG